MKHIVGVVKSAGHRGKEIVSAFEINQRGICSLPRGLLVIVLELIWDVQGANQYSAHTFPSFLYCDGETPNCLRKLSVK